MKRIHLVLVALVVCSCSHQSEVQFLDDGHHKVWIESFGPSDNRLVSVNSNGDSSFWNLPYPTYQLQLADITNDSESNIIVGVVKSTRFDSLTQKRLFVFKYVDDLIRPAWLGSRLGMPIHDFAVQKKDSIYQLLVAEFEKDSSFALARYEWDRFGFKFITYEQRNRSFNPLLNRYEE